MLATPIRTQSPHQPFQTPTRGLFPEHPLVSPNITPSFLLTNMIDPADPKRRENYLKQVEELNKTNENPKVEPENLQKEDGQKKSANVPPLSTIIQQRNKEQEEKEKKIKEEESKHKLTKEQRMLNEERKKKEKKEQEKKAWNRDLHDTTYRFLNFGVLEKHPPSKSEDIYRLHRWFTTLHCELNDALLNGHLIVNPLRNGILLCDVVDCCLSPKSQSRRRVKGGFKRGLDCNRSPKTVGEARENVERAMTVLRADHLISPGLLFDADSYIQDDSTNSVYGLLIALMNTYGPKVDELIRSDCNPEEEEDPFSILDEQEQFSSKKKVRFATERNTKQDDNTEKEEWLKIINLPKSYSRKDDRQFRQDSGSRKIDVYAMAPSSILTPTLSTPVYHPLPYPPEERDDVEHEILSWIISLGVLNGPIPHNIDQILPEMKTGVLLSEIVSFLIKQRIKGISINPKTPTVCRSNLTKTLEILLTTPNFPIENLRCADELFAGDRNAALCILDDLRRFDMKLGDPRKKKPDPAKKETKEATSGDQPMADPKEKDGWDTKRTPDSVRRMSVDKNKTPLSARTPNRLRSQTAGSISNPIKPAVAHDRNPSAVTLPKTSPKAGSRRSSISPKDWGGDQQAPSPKPGASNAAPIFDDNMSLVTTFSNTEVLSQLNAQPFRAGFLSPAVFTGCVPDEHLPSPVAEKGKSGLSISGFSMASQKYGGKLGKAGHKSNRAMKMESMSIFSQMSETAKYKGGKLGNTRGKSNFGGGFKSNDMVSITSRSRAESSLFAGGKSGARGMSGHRKVRDEPFMILPDPLMHTIPLPPHAMKQNQKKKRMKDGESSIVGDALESGENAEETYMMALDVDPQPPYLLAMWMESLGVHLSSPFSLDAPVLHEFSNGVILINLIEVLERRNMTGVQKNPTGKPACLHNIRKVIEHVSGKNAMPLKYLGKERDILEGNQDIILSFLEDIRRAYGQSVKHPKPKLTQASSF
ncbi:hypothetical protein BLNAU_814 [Blattamonas nauphoetae]|uniref:Calponin-homology (CH) domain-containing protein n=1 Tax=Blattamonas nauphoetae TaxID=2049346 RepID=A0ABQ9YKK9_9EUKA|nr:hypothetical protein BLNAU_814 [Blattamonas nauphoetae]